MYSHAVQTMTLQYVLHAKSIAVGREGKEGKCQKYDNGYVEQNITLSSGALLLLYYNLL